jgi:hypothetical protein
MANIATEGVLMKEEPTMVFNDFKFCPDYEVIVYRSLWFF